LKKSLETGLAVVGFGAFGFLLGHMFGKKGGFSAGEQIGRRLGEKEGAKKREEEILREYVSYIPVGEIGRFASVLMEEDGLSEYYPMLVVRPDKYNYLDGPDPDEKENGNEE